MIREKNIFILRIYSIIIIFSTLIFIFSYKVSAYSLNNIQIHGNNYISKEIIYEHIKNRIYNDSSIKNINGATKDLFSTGFFSDVKIYKSDSNIIINVKEKNIIRSIIFYGNKKIKNSKLKNIIVSKENSFFEISNIKKDIKAIKLQYANIGRYHIKVKYEIKKIKDGYYNILFKISEDKRYKIKYIIFKGNKNFSNYRLRNIIYTKESNILSWITNNDVYSTERFLMDKEALQIFYKNHGYADFRVVSVKINQNKDKSEYTIIFYLEEGKIYKFGEINIENHVKSINNNILKDCFKTYTGYIYNKKNIEASINEMYDQIIKYGYIFFKINIIESHNIKKNTISITYKIEEIPHLYIERIEISGNKKTKDYIIRRALHFSEGDAFNAFFIKRSKDHLESLGIFQNISITYNYASDIDQLIIFVDVIEKSTGEFSFGGGYTTGGEIPGISIDTSIAEKNFLGLGQSVRISSSVGQKKFKNYVLSFSDNYFLGRKLTAGFDIFRRIYRVNDNYNINQIGGIVYFSFPITNYLSANIGYNYAQDKYINDVFCDQDCQNLSKMFYDVDIDSIWQKSSINYGIVYNLIDDIQNPHDGFFGKITQEYAGLGGDAKFIKTSGKAMIYKTISEQNDLVLLMSVGAGYVKETKENGIRTFDMFKKDLDMIRGFKFNSIGPIKKSKNGNIFFIGGNIYMNTTIEIQFPIPVIPDNFGFRGAIFVDTANLYDSNIYKKNITNDIFIENNDNLWRSSIGMSLMWNSPFGPLRFDYAWPIKKAHGDLIQNFNIGIYTKF